MIGGMVMYIPNEEKMQKNCSILEKQLTDYYPDLIDRVDYVDITLCYKVVITNGYTFFVRNFFTSGLDGFEDEIFEEINLEVCFKNARNQIENFFYIRS